jgi:hypothetical protein
VTESAFPVLIKNLLIWVINSSVYNPEQTIHFLKNNLTVEISLSELVQVNWQVYI